MRLKIRCDCTGDPPGELITIATVGSLDSAKAFSIGPATELMASPGRKGRRHADGPREAQHRNNGGAIEKQHWCCPGAENVAGANERQIKD